MGNTSQVPEINIELNQNKFKNLMSELLLDVKKIQSNRHTQTRKLTPYTQSNGNEQSVEKEIEQRAKHLKNAALQQDIELKKETLHILFIFLALETVTIFIFSYLQATMIFNFMLEEWSFKLLVTATLIQITFMLQVAVKHLFPQR